MRLLRILVASEVYNKHYEDLTDIERGRILEIAAARSIQNEYMKEQSGSS